jgi:HEAT repeat protein
MSLSNTLQKLKDAERGNFRGAAINCLLGCVLGLFWLVGPGQGLGKDEPLYRSRPLSYWAEALKNDSVAGRKEALNALGRFGPEAKEAVLKSLPALLDSVKEPSLRPVIGDALAKIGPEQLLEALSAALRTAQDPRIREGLANVLARFGPKAKVGTPSLLEALKDPDNKVQAEVVNALSKIGADAVAPLTKVLATDPNALVRAGAARALGRIRPLPTTAVTALGQALQHADPSVRVAAAVALGTIKPGTRIAKEVIQTVVARLLDNNEFVRLEASLALRAIVAESGAAQDLLQALNNPDPDIRANVVTALGKIGADGVKPLVDALKSDRGTWIREGAARALLQIGPKASEAVPTLTSLVGDPDAAVAFAGALALRAIVPDDMKTAVAGPILAALNDGNESVRREATAALGKIVLDRAAVPRLLQSLNSTDSSVTTAVTLALRKVGVEGVGPLLAEFQRKENTPSARAGAARALGLLGPLAKDAVPVLSGALKDLAPSMRLVVAVALGKIDPTSQVGVEILDPVLKALKDPKTTYSGRLEAVQILGRIQPRKAAVPALVQALSSADYAVRNAATTALRMLGGEAVEPMLAELKPDTKIQVWLVVVQALGNLGPQAKGAVPQLVQSIKKGQDPNLYSALVTALSQIGEAAVPQLTQALQHGSDTWVRVGASQALGRIGPPAKGAVGALRAALGDPDQEIRFAASVALGGILPGTPVTKEAVQSLLGNLQGNKQEALWALGRIVLQEAAVLDLVAALTTADDATREGIANALAKVGEAAVDQLRGKLKPEQASPVRAGAARALGLIGRPARRALADLEPAMADKDFLVRFAATGAVTTISPERSLDAREIQTLLEGAHKTDNLSYLTHQEALGALGRVVPKASSAGILVAELRFCKDYYLQQALISALVALGKADAAAIGKYIEAFGQAEDRDVAFRGTIADILYRIGPHAKEAVPTLVQVLEGKDKLEGKDRQYFPRYVAALGAIGPEARSALPALTKSLQNAEPFLLRAVVDAMGQIGPAKEAEPYLLEALRHNDWTIRLAAISVLVKISPVDHAVEAALGKALQDENEYASLRIKAAIALGTLGRRTKEAVNSLVTITEKTAKSNPTDYAAALKALALFGPEAKSAVAVLAEALVSGPDSSRETVADLLGDIGPEAQDAIPALRTALAGDGDPSVRRKAAASLGAIGLADSGVVNDLATALGDRDPRVGQQAAYALGQFRQQARDAIAQLVQSLSKDPRVRLGSVDALGRIGVADAKAVEALLSALSDADAKIRERARFALGRIGKDVVSDLQKALADQHRDVRIRAGAAGALGDIGLDAKSAVATLVAELSSSASAIRAEAAYALGKVVFALHRGDTEEIKALQEAPSRLAKMKSKLDGDSAARLQKLAIDPVQEALSSLKVNDEPAREIPEWLFWPALVLAYVLVCLALCLTLLWLRPLWLLIINDTLKEYLDFTLPAQLGGMKISLRDLLLVRYFNYHRRVLDAWVTKFIPLARERFEDRDTVKDRQVYVDVPVDLDGTVLPDLSAKHLQRSFGRKQRCLLIWGEGGSGKTALVCQVARWAMADEEPERLCKHRMLPILIEQELDYTVAPGQQPFLEAIRGQLRLLIGEPEAIAPELLDCLLRQRRLLVIVDHLSEMSEATRKQIRPGDPSFPANALVITSRADEKLDGVARTIIKPQRIQGNHLSSFMEAYLAKRGKRSLFPDQEYFGACGRLSQMVGARNITVLLARLFAEQMIALKEQSVERELPDNIPDLMLSYLNELNRGAAASDPDDRAVHAAARIVAWECLRGSLRPSDAPREAVSTALAGRVADACTRYLEERLRLIRTIGPARDRVRFGLDPLAEYLAGLHLVEEYGPKEDKWRELLKRGKDTPGGPGGIKGFLLAVRDCCFAKGDQAGVPAWVVGELGTLAGVGVASA